MASGDTLFAFGARDNHPPATVAATPDVRVNTADTPDTNIPVLDFDAGVTEFADFSGVLPEHYAGGGVTLVVGYMMSTATSGGVRLDAQFKSQGDGDNPTTKAYAAVQSVTSSVPATAGIIEYATITFTDGSQIDSLAAGERFTLRVSRDHDHAGDDATGDMELVFVHALES